MSGRRTLLRGGAFVVASTLFAHLSNFIYNATAAHLLGPTEYGSLAAVIALLYVASPFFVAVQTIASRTTTGLVVSGRTELVLPMVRYYGMRLAVGAALLAGFTALFSNAFARFVRVPSAIPVAILGIGFAFSAVNHLQRGVLQGASQFERYAISTIVEASVRVVAAVVLLVVVARSVDVAVVAVVLGSLCGMGATSFLLRALPRGSAREVPRVPIGYSATTLASLIALALLLSVDVLAAKRYLDPKTAGVYAAVSLIGKIVFFATSAAAVLLFPSFSAHHHRGSDARRTLTRAFAFVAAASAVIVGIYFLVPQLVITVLFGERYDAARPYLGWIGIAFGFYALAYLGGTYLLSHQRFAGVGVLAFGVLAQLGALYTFHGSLWAFTWVQVGVFGATAVAVVAACYRDPSTVAV